MEELSELLRIRSISADPEHKDDVRRAAEWVAEAVRRMGEEAQLVETATFPLVVGEVLASGGGDAQPSSATGTSTCSPRGQHEWETDPFEPEVRDGWLYARGVADDKGQLWALLKATEELAAAGELPVNVRFVCDGEEETGGHQVVEFIASDERGADAAVIFDSAMLRPGAPVFHVATRGMIYFHVRVRTRAQPALGHVRGCGAELDRGADADASWCPSRRERPCARASASRYRPSFR